MSASVEVAVSRHPGGDVAARQNPRGAGSTIAAGPDPWTKLWTAAGDPRAPRLDGGLVGAVQSMVPTARAVRREQLSRPRPELDDVARIEALRDELRRLGGEVMRLEEDNQLFHERIAHLQRELEQTRAKIPKKISTS